MQHIGAACSEPDKTQEFDIRTTFAQRALSMKSQEFPEKLATILPIAGKL